MVCGMTPSSAATTRIAISVTCAPRARMEVNAAWPGVSRKVICLSFTLTRYAPMCWVMPPASPSVTLVLRIASSSEVLPWSTWPITTTTGSRGSRSSSRSSRSSNSCSSMVTWTSFSTLQPISSATIAAVSKSMISETDAMTPSLIRPLMTSAAVRFMRLASSPTEISSGIMTLTGIFLSAAICCWRCRRFIFSCSSWRRLLPKGLERCSDFLVSFCFLGPRDSMRSALASTSLSTWSSYLARLTSPVPRVSMRCTCLTLLCTGWAGFSASGCFAGSAGLFSFCAGAAAAGFASCAGFWAGWRAAICAFRVCSISAT